MSFQIMGTAHLGQARCICSISPQGCPLHQRVERIAMTQPLQPVADHRFTVKRQDGIGPHPDDKPCAIPTCGQPKSAHQWPTCEGSLNIKGEGFMCDLTAPHSGWAHQNAEAQAVWA